MNMYACIYIYLVLHVDTKRYGACEEMLCFWPWWVLYGPVCHFDHRSHHWVIKLLMWVYQKIYSLEGKLCLITSLD